MQIIQQMKRDLEMSGLKEETCECYLRRANLFVKSLKIPVESVTQTDAREFLRHLRYEKKYCIGTVNAYRSAIKYLFQVTLDKPWTDLKVPRLRGYKPLPSILSKSEVTKFIESIPDKMYRMVLYTMYSSGLRVGEAVALRVRDIDSERMQIYVEKSKSGSSRYALLGEKNLLMLRDYVQEWKRRYRYSFKPDNYLFPSSHKKGTHITKKTIKNIVWEQAKVLNYGKRVTSHSMRHAFATHLLEKGVDIHDIKELLGHTSLQSTNVYLHVASLAKGIKSPLDTEDE